MGSNPPEDYTGLGIIHLSIQLQFIAIHQYPSIIAPLTTTHPSSVPFLHVVDIGTLTTIVYIRAAELELCIKVADYKGLLRSII
jgi:hypothetical protein